MSDDIVRKIVKPAHKGARIPDPAHPGMDISDEGTEVTWDSYWIAREKRGEIEVCGASPVSPPEPQRPDFAE